MQTYTLSFENRDSYLYAHLIGQDSFSASLSYWNDIADKVADLGLPKLLVHENLTGEVTGTEICELIMDLLGSGLRDVKIAFYDENSDDTDLNAMGRLVANTRGVNVKIFHSLEAARHWIEQDD